MITLEILEHETGEDGNSIIINQRIELTEEDALDYIELDTLLRDNDNDDLVECVSDFGGLYSNDILGFFDFSQLRPCLEACRTIVNQKVAELLDLQG